MKKSKSKSLTKKTSKKLGRSKKQTSAIKNKTTRKAGCFDWLCQYENRYLPSSSPITRRRRNVLTLGMKRSSIKNMTPRERASIVATTVRNTLNKVKGRGSPSEAHKNLFRLNRQHKQTMKEFELNRKRERGQLWLAYWNRELLKKGLPMIPKIFDEDIPDGYPPFESPGRSSEELAIETRNMEQRKSQGRERRRKEASVKRRNRELLSATEKGFSDDGN